MQLNGQQLIGFASSGEGRETFRGYDPSAGRELEPVFHEATEGEIDRAMRLADRAFGEYRHKTPAERAAFLRAIGEEIDALGPALIERAAAETGLPADTRLPAERARTIGQMKMFAALLEEGSWVDARIDPALPDRKPMPRPDIRRMLIPMGPIVAFAASNFPLAISVAGNDTASAPGGRLHRRRQGPPGPPRHQRDDRGRHRQGRPPDGDARGRLLADPRPRARRQPRAWCATR